MTSLTSLGTERRSATQPGRPGPGAAAPAVSATGLTVRYGDWVALRDVTLTLQPGELIALIGPNGAGKSTLIKAILGVVPIAKGSVRVLGQPIRHVHAEVAYVPQREQVDWDFPVTVADVVLMGRTVRLGWLRRPGRRDHELVRAALEQVRLADRADAQIGELSGGQQQRVFLARALVQEARILLLDEPLVGVDPASQEVILDLLVELARGGRTVVMATHDLPTSARIADRLVLLNGRVVAAGPPAAVFNADTLAATFGGGVIITGALDHAVHHGIAPRPLYVDAVLPGDALSAGSAHPATAGTAACDHRPAADAGRGWAVRGGAAPPLERGAERER